MFRHMVAIPRGSVAFSFPASRADVRWETAGVFLARLAAIARLLTVRRFRERALTFKSLAVSLRTTSFCIQKNLHGARFALSVLCGSKIRQRPLLYTLLTE
jgi:hypothetical protein